MAVILVLIYALLMSVWWVTMRLLMKMGTEKNPFPNNIIRAVSGFGAGLLVVWSLARHGGMSYVQSLPTEFWILLAIDVVLNTVIAYCYVKAMQKSVASIAVHVTLLAPVVAIGTSTLFGIDKLPTLLSALGIFTILFGLYVLHFSPKKYGSNLAGPIVDIWYARGNWLIYAIGIAVFAGCAIPIDKRVVLLADSSFAPGLNLLLSWGVVYAIMAFRSGDLKALATFPTRKVVIGLIVMGLTFGIAQAFQAHAYYYQHAATVASLKRLDAPFTVLWAFLILRHEEQAEGSFVFRVLGSVVALVGVVLISLG